VDFAQHEQDRMQLRVLSNTGTEFRIAWKWELLTSYGCLKKDCSLETFGHIICYWQFFCINPWPQVIISPSFLIWFLLPTNGRGLLLHLNTLRHTTLIRNPLDEGSGPSQRPLSENTQHLKQKNIHAHVGIQPAVPVSWRPQTYILDRATTGIGHFLIFTK
jgi:hypothetical protein